MVPLADFDPVTLEMIPILIKEIPSPQYLTDGPYQGGIRFDLEFLEDAKWDNGSEITAKDFLFTLKTIRNKEIESTAWRSFFEKIVDVKIDPENDKKFSVIFSEPYLLAREAIVTANLYPKYAYDPNNATDVLDLNGELMDTQIPLDSIFVKNFNGVKHSREEIVGAGPYKFIEWVTDQYVLLERKENYWGKNSSNPFLQAKPSSLIFKIIPDEVTALTLLRSGEIDVMGAVSSANFEASKTKETEQFNFATTQLIRYYYLMLNNEDEILSDVNVRKALAHSTNVEQMIVNFENGLGIKQKSLFHELKSYANPNIKGMDYDLDLARKYLEKAGWKDGDNDGVLEKEIDGEVKQLELDVSLSKSELGKNVSLMLKEGAEQVGFKINLVSKAGGQLRADVREGNYQIYTASVVQDPNNDDPYNRWHSEGPRNYTKFSNKNFDKLTEECRVTLDGQRLKELYQEMEQIVADDCPVIFLYSPKERFILSKNLEAKLSPKRPGYLANTFKTRAVFSEN